MNNHTPGPWIVEHSGTGDARVIARCGWVNKDGSPFDPTIVERIDFPTARLIAAAPDLLASLEGLLRLVSDVLTDSQLDHVNCGRTIRGAIDPARAAITRATVPPLT